MGIKDFLSKERITSGLKSLSKLRPQVSHSSILPFSILLLILFIAFAIRLFALRWEVPTGALHLSEFDPYFQYRLTEYIVKNGFISWAWPPPGWIDTYRWYPGGINVANTGYPGLPFVSAFLYIIISSLGVNITLMDFCALLPAFMGAVSCLAIYFLGKDFGGKTIGLFAAFFLAFSPSYIQRTSVGFYDDEIIGIFALILFMMLFLRSIEENRPLSSSVKYALGSGIMLGYFCSGWGAAFYPIGVTVLLAFMLVLIKRYSQRLLFSYSLTFGLGLFVAMNVPRNGPGYITTIAILPVAGVFLALCFVEVFQSLTSAKWKNIIAIIFPAVLIGGFLALWQLGYMRDIAGKFVSVINPFERSASPLYESVAEHRISGWGTLYYEFGITIIFFIIGFFFILRNLSNRNLFLLIMGLTSIYFASSMVRLLVLAAPVFSLLTAIGIIGILKPFYTLLREPPKILTKKKYSLDYVGKEFSGITIFLIFLILMTSFAFSPHYGGMPKVYRQANTPITITAASLPLVPSEPIRAWMDALEWMRSNLQSTTVICSWWDYGYWLTVLGNVTSLADNATVNVTQIGLIGRVYMSNEVQAVRILKEQFDGPHGPPQYILVFTTFASDGQDYFYGGDEGKWTWMARIANSSEIVRELYAEDYGIWEYNEWGARKEYNTFGNATQAAFIWNDLGKNTTIYKLMQNAKAATGISVDAPALTYFKNPEFFGGIVASLGQDQQGNPVYLVALVSLYEVDYESYNLAHDDS